MQIFERLTERKVLQWAAAYLVGGWGILEATDLLASEWGWPDVTVRAVTVALAVGLAAVLVVAWFHGESGRQNVPGLELVLLGTILLGGGVALAAVLRTGIEAEAGAAGAAGAASRDGGPPGLDLETPEASIAVLPFVDLSGADPYFGDGLAEELLNLLADIPDLKVAARSSSFSFRDQNADIREVGRVLGVAHALEGSVRRASERVRIAARLADARTGFQVWNDQYDRQLEDVFEIQEEIAREIISALEVELAGALGEGRGTDDPEAHDLYLRGLDAFAVRSYEQVLEAIEYFTRAAERDSTYALAHAGTAVAYSVLPLYGPEPAAEVAAARARISAEWALALDSTLAEPHAAICQTALNWEFDWDRAEAACRTAIRLRPSYSTAYQWTYELLVTLGRIEEAGEALRTSLELDPESVIARNHWAIYHDVAGEHDEAIRLARGILESYPDFTIGPATLFLALLGAGDEEGAAAHLAAVEGRVGFGGERLDADAAVEALSGGGGGAERRAAAERAVEAVAQPAMRAFWRAVLMARIGEEEEALESVETLVEARFVPGFLRFSALEPLHDRPEWARILGSIGLEP